MAIPKAFNNVIIGQFALTGVPVKVYASNQFLTITDADGNVTTISLPVGNFTF